ncbi:AAA family ATPase [Pseudomonas tolaasii]|uniref:AAA family ATPase n=2 Tax=Pseudomonas tolaasii TaxID=29442 RepID=A0A7Y8AMP3_PSETO|nr:AAA family ATPase [Pseudomonas tolaasii]ARB31726.1 ClpV1 family T6SS ATPase [Pseudomonas tolaasii]KAB0471002.1 AAA domain-containing protein [Pseudomonas tolaasii]MBY8939331.1 AAA family ATPase [Pseudomonas tolaasii]NWC18989.1 AAA family ATPase [Pseudomonas tolaasii]NWC42181.1 AAA family ATPase [Pseudomonas tolaasii]
MINVDLQQLINNLTVDARVDLERSSERCVMRGGREVLVEDLLLALLEHPDGVLTRALEDAGVTTGELHGVLQPKSENSATRNPVFAQALVQWLQQALMVAHVELRRHQVDHGALLLALLRHPTTYAGSGYYRFLSRLNADRVRDFLVIRTPDVQPVATQSLLQRFTFDLTCQARDGLIDPVLCRDEEICQLIDILVRRRKNNPILVGEAGVGKTAVVEGLALKIAAGHVPDALKSVRVLILDLGLLQAGASLQGEFERRLKGVIDEVNAAPQAVILFIDEAHTLVGAGGPAGGSDAANLLKPALARGELRTIAATTWSEYKKYIEKDPALARRFQPVLVTEPGVEQAVSILRGLVPVYEASHGVYVRDDAVVAAAHLSARYLVGRQLPDKAVDVLDTACARVRTRAAMPAQTLQQLRAEQAEVSRQHHALSRDLEARLPADAQVLQSLSLRLEAIERECGLLEQELAQHVPASTRLEVCPRLIAQVVSAWTGIPVEQLSLEPNEKISGFADALRARILGQDQAVIALDRAMRAVAAGLNKVDAPVGVFLLVGPSGVGKTETALALADLLYGGERFITTINMSEYQEKHALSRLIGAPPGYVGYGEGGVLTEAVRQRPYSVVLLDEVEKADPEVLNLFYQVFDKGRANDGEGREIDFRNTLFLMTSNLGSDCINKLCADGQRPDAQVLQDAIHPLLRAHFKPALLARMRVVPYYPIAGPVLQDVTALKLASLGERLLRRKLAFTYSSELVTHMTERCAHGDSGARYIDQWIERHLLPQMVDQVLAAMATGESLSQAHACLDGSDHPICEFS